MEMVISSTFSSKKKHPHLTKANEMLLYVTFTQSLVDNLWSFFVVETFGILLHSP